MTPTEATSESDGLAGLRREVRAFLAEQLRDLPDERRAESWQGFDRDFSKAVAARGWIGMTWPREHGGGGRTLAERYVVQEEMLAVGAPVAAHWVADRQSGPLILRVGRPQQIAAHIPRILAGEACFCIGMSEPEAGSDLAAIRTKAERTQDGWRVNGQKLWTTHGARADTMILLARTRPVDTERRHAGMSQFLVDLRTPGITIKPIRDMTGGSDFSEVLFDDVLLGEDALLGAEGAGWAQVISELALERSGPERFLSSMPLLTAFADEDEPDSAALDYLGRSFAELLTIREMSLDIVVAFARGEEPATKAAMVKDLGADFEQGVVADIADLAAWDGSAMPSERRVDALLRGFALSAPSFSLRGGTREILRGIIARELAR